MDYISLISSQFGAPVWLLYTIIVWSAVWKLLALWKSARKTQIVWFVILGVINTLGILEILYIYIFSEMKPKKKSPASVKKKTVKKKSSQRKR